MGSRKSWLDKGNGKIRIGPRRAVLFCFSDDSMVVFLGNDSGLLMLYCVLSKELARTRTRVHCSCSSIGEQKILFWISHFTDAKFRTIQLKRDRSEDQDDSIISGIQDEIVQRADRSVVGSMSWPKKIFRLVGRTPTLDSYPATAFFFSRYWNFNRCVCYTVFSNDSINILLNLTEYETISNAS